MSCCHAIKSDEAGKGSEDGDREEHGRMITPSCDSIVSGDCLDLGEWSPGGPIHF